MQAFLDFFEGKTYADAANGLFGIKHILWITLTFVLLAALYPVLKRHKRIADIALTVFAVTMLVLRFVKYFIMYPFVWENSFARIIPYELCTIMSYVLPFTVLFRTHRLNSFIYPLAVFGGTVTLGYADWVFDGNSINFNKLESMIVHILLIYIPVLSAAADRYRFDVAKIYRPFAAMALLLVYAEVANEWITPGANHMYTRVNPLPKDTAPLHHMFLLGAGFVLFMAIIHAPDIVRRITAGIKRTGKTA